MKHTILALALTTTSLTPALAEEFFFPHVGMTVTSVDTWEVVSGAEFVAINQSASFGSEELDALLHSQKDAPFFSMLSQIRMNSGVRAGFNAFAFDGHLPDMDQAAKNIEDYMLGTFRDAEMTRARERTTLGGAPAVTMALEYTLEMSPGQTRRIYEEVWLVPRKDNYVTISYGTLADDDDGAIWRDMRRTLNSISWKD